MEGDIEEVSEGSRSKSKSRGSDFSQRSAWLTPRGSPEEKKSLERTPSPPLPPSQESAVVNVKTMLEEENLSGMQHRNAWWTPIRTTEGEWWARRLRTYSWNARSTIISLASQLTEESLQLGVLPEDNVRPVCRYQLASDVRHEPRRGSVLSWTIGSLSMPPIEFLRPLTQESNRKEVSCDTSTQCEC